MADLNDSLTPLLANAAKVVALCGAKAGFAVGPHANVASDMRFLVELKSKHSLDFIEHIETCFIFCVPFVAHLFTFVYIFSYLFTRAVLSAPVSRAPCHMAVSLASECSSHVVKNAA